MALAQSADVRTRLLDTARTMILRGEHELLPKELCAEAGSDRAMFEVHFASPIALMAALMSQQSTSDRGIDEPVPPQATGEGQVGPVGDAWLERRLRVFERALNALEARAEETARAHERAIAELKDAISALAASQACLQERPADPPPEHSGDRDETHVPQQTNPQGVEAQSKDPQPQLVRGEPDTMMPALRSEMSEVLQTARSKARTVVTRRPARSLPRSRWLVMGTVSLAVLFGGLCLALSDTARATQSPLQGAGVSHRHVQLNGLARVIALADSGDRLAKTQLALAYLRGGSGIESDSLAAMRWGKSAAEDGQPVAQFLMGEFYREGESVRPDAELAFRYFSQAANQGNLKAMHNLAIAFLEGSGTAKDPVQAARWFRLAAERGYVDSAFDLAVLYERGTGVHQDLKEALKWYRIAALAGDKPSQQRCAFLTQQIDPVAARAVMTAARAFTPLPALAQANFVPQSPSAAF